MFATNDELQMIGVNQQDIDSCIKVLERMTGETKVSNSSSSLKRVFSNIKRLSKDNIKSGKKLRYEKRRARRQIIKLQQTKHDTLLDTTVGEPNNHCYVCKTFVIYTHDFYRAMCENCGILNFKKRNQACELSDKIALVTGARIKIGFCVTLKLLRAGCTVVATTRFIVDATQRYSAEPDYANWRHKLHIVRADFSRWNDMESLFLFIETNFTSLDILVNNAAQTIAKPPAFYAELIAKEKQVTTIANNNNTQQQQLESKVATTHTELLLFPVGRYDKDNQQLDLRKQNSWITTIETTSINELLETQIINCTIPFMLIQRLTPLLSRQHDQKISFIVNVSAMEGVFNQPYKSSRHPHTNIAKAGLNMITRTIATDYLKKYNISVNSVDTGFITNEFPFEHNHSTYVPPLDVVDGAARILDPIFTACITGQVSSGVFFKDYQVSDW